MHVLVIENFEKTPLGVLGDALAEAGASIDLRQAFRGDAVPATEAAHDALVVLGGGQSALDDADSPWLPGLARLTRRFGEAGKAVLGVCLGAQVIARAYGAENILGRPVEFGWREVRPTAAGRTDPVIAALGEGARMFHWHNDTFTLPPSAVRLAASDMTAIQAFRIGDAVYGIQFHFEANLPLVESWSADFAGVIAAYAPDWPVRLPADAARFAGHADAGGMAIARAWVALAGRTAHRQAASSRLDLAYGLNRSPE
ncbi:MAG TPA: type 1 glutamine amidotransferase [Bauldia sp.]|nr:type 1 glutamine amidotransferase [Bauldia sp.]